MLGFIYYLEYKRCMFLLENGGPKTEPTGSPRGKNRKRPSSHPGRVALIFTPCIAGLLGLGIELNPEMLLIGVLIICAGLAIVVSCGVFKMKGLADSN